MGNYLNYERYEEIKRIVVDTFVKYDVNCIPISGFELATKMGVKIIPYSAYSDNIRHLLIKQSGDGFTVEFNNGERFIFYNEQKNYGRINHTLMHEVGHIVLNHTEDNDLAEAEVNFFAKYALAPPVLIHKLKLDDPWSISNAFDISFEAAEYALNYYNKWLKVRPQILTSYEQTLWNLFQEVS